MQQTERLHTLPFPRGALRTSLCQVFSPKMCNLHAVSGNTRQTQRPEQASPSLQGTKDRSPDNLVLTDAAGFVQCQPWEGPGRGNVLIPAMSLSPQFFPEKVEMHQGHAEGRLPTKLGGFNPEARGKFLGRESITLIRFSQGFQIGSLQPTA